MTPEQAAALAAIEAGAAALRQSLTDAPPPPTYTLTAEPPQVNEGAVLTFRLTTTNVAPGTLLPYVLQGVSAADVGAPMSGQIVVGQDGRGSLVVPLLADQSTEGPEAITCVVGDRLASASATIGDTSVSPPPPPLPPPSGLSARVINPGRVVLIGTAITQDRYQRFQSPMILGGDSARIEVRVCDFAAGGGFRAFAAQPYTLLIDGIAAGAQQVSGTDLAYTVNLRDLSPGWHWLDVQGPDTCVPWPIFVKRDGAQVTQWPIVTHSEEMVFPPSGEQIMVHYGMAPATWQPRTQPLPARSWQPTAQAIGRASLALRTISPARYTDIHTPTSIDGVVTTAGRQRYFWGDFTAEIPVWPLLDGPRGRGTVTGPTHLQVGRTAIYFCDPWRVGKIAADGTVTTLAGYRHPGMAANWTAPAAEQRAALELVGDWSAVPIERRGFHELWGMAWDTRTVQQGTGAPIPNPPQPDEPPHDTNPVLFVADSQRNRVCRLEFDGKSHGTPPKVTEFLTGLADPWDVVFDAGVLYVSERKAHRIVAYDAISGQMLRVVVSGADIAGIGSASRLPFRRPGVTLAQCRAEQCVLPEGLYVLDGWLYFGSRIMEQVKRVHLTTGTVEPVCSVLMDNNSQFAKIAVSDGTFGPRGSVFVAHWSVIGYGHPHAYLPDGRAWDLLSGYDMRGQAWPPLSYPTAVAVGGGRIVFGSMGDGLIEMGAATAADKLVDRDRYVRGQAAYWRAGYRLSHGWYGWGHFGLPLPWGVSPDIDYFLQAQGHIKE